jgi:hypothetical protein
MVVIKLESISFPTSICEIGDNSFLGIPNLKKVVIPEELENLSDVNDVIKSYSIFVK